MVLLSTNSGLLQWAYSVTSIFSHDSVAGIKSCIPHSGLGFVGEFLMVKSANGQEYFGGKLSSPLNAQRSYCVEYFLKRATSFYGTESRASDGFGIYFTEDSMVSSGCCTSSCTPQIKNPIGNVIYDTSWISMSGSFIAEGGERYVIVGSFKDAEETVFDPPSWYATT